ncbi:protein UPSTREAM OF FLC [Cocos nucifera]|uniref:Protein UPSTREAM OF FLC n=1 Tax=Cocos nucifera TaxID=13894 RepID=A0A8K0IID5_COCNU|nr:protein UPSTREAM OF FLC [Cocos nucifera]
MERRIRRYGNQTSPERTKVWVEPPPKHHHQHHQQQQQHQQQGRKISVVYYLCRNRHLDHPHFIEVPVFSSEGLYLRDVINRLNVLRGKRMAAMYSWSCKRSYKNGFVWHDLSEDDLVLPVQGSEYVLKGSELVDRPPPGRQHRGIGDPKVRNQTHPQQESPASCRTHEASSSSSSPPLAVKEPKLSQSPPPRLQESGLSPTGTWPGSSGNLSPDPVGRTTPSSPSLAGYRVYKPIGARDASTQTDDNGGRKARTASVSTDDGLFRTEFDGSHHHSRSPRSMEGLEIVRDEISPPSSASSLGAGKMDTLENLIRAEAAFRVNNFRVTEEFPMRVKLKVTNLLMQLISCGSISVKGYCHGFELVPTYRPRFAHVNFSSPVMLGELGWPLGNARVTGLFEYLGGSLTEAKNHEEQRASSSEDRIFPGPSVIPALILNFGLLT